MFLMLSFAFQIQSITGAENMRFADADAKSHVAFHAYIYLTFYPVGVTGGLSLSQSS